MYRTDPAQYIITAGSDLDDLVQIYCRGSTTVDRDQSVDDLSDMWRGYLHKYKHFKYDPSLSPSIFAPEAACGGAVLVVYVQLFFTLLFLQIVFT